jgi:hypothetical protein
MSISPYFAVNAMTPIKFFKPKSNALEPFDMVNMFRSDGTLLLKLKSELSHSGAGPLLSGLTFPSVVNAMVGTVSFTGYSALLNGIHSRQTIREQEEHFLLGVAFAGATAGFCQSFISCPAETLKLYMTMQAAAAANASPATQASDHGMHWWSRVHRIMNVYGGASSLYRPWRLLAARDSLGIATFFTSYETTKIYSEPLIWSMVVSGLKPQNMRPVIVFDEQAHRWHEKATKYGTVLLAGGLAGLLYALVQQ